MRRNNRSPIVVCTLWALALSPAAVIFDDGMAVAGPPDPTCRVVEVNFTPQGFPARNGRTELSPQIAVWVEQPSGQWQADLYVTRSVGLYGLGNRPGQALLKSDYRWPYARRPMALPIWAYRRGKTYGYIAMGGKCEPTCPVDFQGSPSDDDKTIAYHGPVSSTEPYYCSPSGWRTQKMGNVDVVSCASAFYGSKGYYVPGKTSVYPPRADLTVTGASDSPDVAKFARDNDVAAISAATPANGSPVDPIRWFTTSAVPDGDYNLMVEVNIESDFNASWASGKAMAEPHSEWNYLGKDPFGQPSILYKIPFRLDMAGRIATSREYAGYGDWQGNSGTINPPDSTISAAGGSGADRLKINTDGTGDWRVKVSVTPCDPGMCDMPLTPTSLDLSQSTDSTLTVQFKVPDGPQAGAYRVRYSDSAPITEANYMNASPGPSTNLGRPGDLVSAQITGLRPKTHYYVAVRPESRCGALGTLLNAETTTSSASFATLSGCFIATAAYGAEWEPEVAMLRHFRDQYLLDNPLGQAAVASYYTMSPSLASLIAGHEPLRQLAQRALSPVIHAVKATTHR
jgi:hypothetical protein